MRTDALARDTADLVPAIAEGPHARWGWEPQDMALKIAEPETYAYISGQISLSRRERERAVELMVRDLRGHIHGNGLRAAISGRPKNLYSLHTKMQQQSLDFAQVGDLLALRVVVGTVAECYDVLEVLHAVWPPANGLIADHIAVPKPNGYRSLHTKVVRPDGVRLEVQIRTTAMHHHAERGPSAHYLYKSATGAGAAAAWQRLLWLACVLEMNANLPNAHERTGYDQLPAPLAGWPACLADERFRRVWQLNTRTRGDFG